MAVTQTWCTVAQIDTDAVSNGETSWLDLTDDQKNRANINAAQDIIMYIGQVDEDGTLSWTTDQRMIDANIHQAIYVGKVESYRKVAESTKAIAQGQYSDGNISLSQTSPRELAPYAKYLVDLVKQDALRYSDLGFGSDVMHNTFGRG